jgi:single-strand DNA-binding protein
MTGSRPPPDQAETEAFMNNLNNILIEGNLVRDPILRTTQKGTSLCTLRLASNRYYKQDTGFERETGFFDVEIWAKLAEQCYNSGHKGQGVRVTGRLKQNRWAGQDGKSYSRITIVAEHVAFKPEFNRDNSNSKDAGILAGEAADWGGDMPKPEYADIQEAGTVVF